MEFLRTTGVLSTTGKQLNPSIGRNQQFPWPIRDGHALQMTDPQLKGNKKGNEDRNRNDYDQSVG